VGREIKRIRQPGEEPRESSLKTLSYEGSSDCMTISRTGVGRHGKVAKEKNLGPTVKGNHVICVTLR